MLSSLAGEKGGMGALSLVKQARADFEAALKLDPRALDGAAYTSLGALYYQVPGWPLGFGDDDQARQMLKKGLEAKTWADINKPEVKIAVDVGSANEAVARRFAPNATIKSLKSRDEVMLEMSSGRVDCVVNALVLGLTAIAKNPNLGTYKILTSPSVTIASGTAVRREQDKRWRDFLSVWIDYNRGIGQMREWFVKGLGLAGVKAEDVPVELNI